jgi:hypothetical protein
MAKLPPTPPEWKESAALPLENPLSGPTLNNEPKGLLDGWQAPDWSLEHSGLSLLLHPETIAQIDFGQGSRSRQEALAGRVPPSNVRDTLVALGAKSDHDFLSTDQGARLQLAGGNDDSYHPSKTRADAYRGPTYNPRGIGPNASNPNRPRDFGASDSVPDAKAGYLGMLQSFFEPFVDARKLKNQDYLQQLFEGRGGASQMERRNFVGEDLGQYYNRPGYMDKNGDFWVDRNYDGSVDEYIFFKNGVEYRQYDAGIQKWRPDMRPPFPPPPVNKRYDGN